MKNVAYALFVLVFVGLVLIASGCASGKATPLPSSSVEIPEAGSAALLTPEPEMAAQLQAGLDDHPYVVTSPCTVLAGKYQCQNNGDCFPDSVITDLEPTFTWDWPHICVPEGWAFTLAEGETMWQPFFVTHITTYDESVKGPTRSFTFPGQLQPNTEYRWTIKPLASGTGSNTAYLRFRTGPHCEPPFEIAPVPRKPVQEFPEKHATGNYRFSWDFPFGECAVDGFELEIATDTAFTNLIHTEVVESPTEDVVIPLTLEDCRVYPWRVRAISRGVPGPWSEYSRLVIASESWFKCLFGNIPVFIIEQNAICRIGPSQAYEARRYYEPGEALEVTGRNRDGTWLQLKDCWIYKELGTLNWELEKLEVKRAPPLPTPTPTPEPTRACVPSVTGAGCK